MRVLISPDSFTGSMTAPQAAQAISQGWLRTAPTDETILLPVSDGGPGFVSTLAVGLRGELRSVPTVGPWGEPTTGEVLLVPSGVGLTAYLESAQAAGAAVQSQLGEPGRASSAGVATLIRGALAAGASRIVAGLGGTLTTDGGAGMLAGLGATASDDHGRDITAALTQGGAALAHVASVDLDPPRDALRGIDLVIASDVDSPLLGPRGAAHGFAPQKGAGPGLVGELEDCLKRFAHACGRLPDGRSPAVALGAGAAGGLGFAMLHLGGRRVPGIDWVLDALRIGVAVSSCDLVITGEGSFDWQSLRGKVITGICNAAMEHGRPVLVLAGQCDVGRREWMAIGASGVAAILDPDDPAAPARDLAQAMAEGPTMLAGISARAARTWSR